MFNEIAFCEDDGLGAFDWGALIGGGLSFGSTIVGGIYGGKAADKQLKALQEANKLKAAELEQQRLAVEAQRGSGLDKSLLLYGAIGLLAVAMLMKK